MMRVVGYLLMVLGLAFLVVGLFDLVFQVWTRTIGATSAIAVSGLTALLVALADLLRELTHLPAWLVSSGVGIVLIYFGWWLVWQAEERARRRRLR